MTKQEIITEIRTLADKCIELANESREHGDSASMVRVERVLRQGVDNLTELANGLEDGE